MAEPAYDSSEKASVRIYRDSLGRRRTELFRPGFTLTEIYDRMTSTGYILDDDNRIAHRTAAPIYRPHSSAPPLPSGSGEPRRVVEKLGVRGIEGLLCEGTPATS